MSWLVWLWLLMFIALVFQVAGMVGGLADVFKLAGLPLTKATLTILVAASCAMLLVLGRYALVETLSTVLVALFVFSTLIAVGALQFTEFALTPAQRVDRLVATVATWSAILDRAGTASTSR